MMIAIPASMLLILACIGAGHAVIEQFKRSRSARKTEAFNLRKRERAEALEYFGDIQREAIQAILRGKK